jgi:adenine deaminase
MNSKAFRVSGNIVDVVHRQIYKGTVWISNGRIERIEESENSSTVFILPGLIDSHIHIESSMLIPSEFARLAVRHGTVATVSDPHEIANILGMKGIRFMIENGKKVPFKFNFGASSCVPATAFETAGAIIGVEDIEQLLSTPEIKYLSEMMNFPGVLSGDPEVLKKIAIAKKYGKPVDGHAPGLRGELAGKYIRAGITTDHECYSLEEATDKIKAGMKILIREGSAAKSFEALVPLIETYPEWVMFCSDDLHPDDLVKGHMNLLVRRAIAMGFDPIDVLRCCTLNPAKHYNLDTGLLQQGDPADFIVVDNLTDFNVLSCYVYGEKVAEREKTLIVSSYEELLNKFSVQRLDVNSLKVTPESNRIRVIKAFDGQLITGQFVADAHVENDNITSDPDADILKIVVKNRYSEAPPAVAFVSGFGIRSGAIASSVAHDSHNIIAVGSDDASIAKAINLIIDERGGISYVNETFRSILPLPYAGIMSGDDGYSVARIYETMNLAVKEMGSPLKSPYMTLSFMGLLVIPDLKLSDKGLFDGSGFKFTNLFTS